MGGFVEKNLQVRTFWTFIRVILNFNVLNSVRLKAIVL